MRETLAVSKKPERIPGSNRIWTYGRVPQIVLQKSHPEDDPMQWVLDISWKGQMDIKSMFQVGCGYF